MYLQPLGSLLQRTELGSCPLRMGPLHPSLQARTPGVLFVTHRKGVMIAPNPDSLSCICLAPHCASILPRSPSTACYFHRHKVCSPVLFSRREGSEPSSLPQGMVQVTAGTVGGVGCYSGFQGACAFIGQAQKHVIWECAGEKIKRETGW